VSVHVT